jgi:hypothetical protein
LKDIYYLFEKIAPIIFEDILHILKDIMKLSIHPSIHPSSSSRKKKDEEEDDNDEWQQQQQ